MCQSCSGADPFAQKSLIMDGVDANSSRDEIADDQTWDSEPRSRREFANKSQRYMEWVFDNYSFNVLTRDMVEIEESARLSRLLGRCDPLDAEGVSILLSWEAYDNRGYGWDRLKNTIRHELVHGSTYVEYGFMGHGPTFIEEAERLDVQNIDRYDEPDPRWFIVCNHCGKALWKKRKCKSVKQAQSCGRIGRCAKCKNNDWEVMQKYPAENHSLWTQRTV